MNRVRLLYFSQNNYKFLGGDDYLSNHNHCSNLKEEAINLINNNKLSVANTIKESFYIIGSSEDTLIESHFMIKGEN